MKKSLPGLAITGFLKKSIMVIFSKFELTLLHIGFEITDFCNIIVTRGKRNQTRRVSLNSNTNLYYKAER